MTAFLLWAQRYQKYLLGVLVVLAVAAAGYFYYVRSEAIKRQRAEEALNRALQAMSSGNMALAQSDLERVVRSFKGTGAATQAGMLLAQTYYEAGQPEEGIQRLREIEASADKPFRASVIALIADGYDIQGKPSEAAQEYLRAAEVALFPADRDNYRASAARHFTIGGNRAEARRIWEALATEGGSAVAGEARVRLGELTVEPAKRS